MRPLSEALATLNVRHGRSAPDPTSPEEIETWLIEHKLWPTERIAADLRQARRDVEHEGADRARGAAAAMAVDQLERELALARLRDRLQADRPAECWCFGIGGHGRVYVPVPDGDPLPSWRVWCDCSEARQLRAELDDRRAAASRARRQRTIERLWGSLPTLYADWTLETLAACSEAHARLARRVQAWIEDGDRWLYLHGPVGRGKSGAAIGAVKVLADRGYTAVFQETSELLERLRDSYAGVEAFTESRDVRWESLVGVEILLLDDIGAERHRPGEAVDWASEKLWQLIGYRHRERRRTILTSNLSIDALGDHLGHSRVPSRIQELALVLDCSQLPNLRKQAAEVR